MHRMRQWRLCWQNEAPFLTRQRQSRFETLFISRNERVRGEVGKEEFANPGYVSFTSPCSVQGDMVENMISMEAV